MAMAYDVVKSSKTDGVERLIIKVNASIRKGWRPLGGICEGTHSFFQSMIKEKKK